MSWSEALGGARDAAAEACRRFQIAISACQQHRDAQRTIAGQHQDDQRLEVPRLFAAPWPVAEMLEAARVELEDALKTCRLLQQRVEDGGQKGD